MAQLMQSLWENLDNKPLKASLQGKYYNLKRWPNFGFSEYRPEYVQVSAYLSRHQMNKRQILKLVEMDEKALDHFLNSSHLVGILTTSSMPSKNEFSDSSKSAKNSFLSSLKKLFSIH